MNAKSASTAKEMSIAVATAATPTAQCVNGGIQMAEAAAAATTTATTTTTTTTNIPLHLRFSAVNYTSKTNKKSVHILNDVCGELHSGRLTAILGPSGAGKTSLLNVLAGFKASGVSGHFELNDQERELKSFRRMCAYIPQDFVMLNLLTVQETLRNSADLKLPRGTSSATKEIIINDILQLLNMKSCRHTLVQHLSGGERKRLSIGIELVTNPPLMLFDEPTSGLDSVASAQVIEHLRTLAHEGRIVACVVHQPSSRLMRQFDDVLVMCAGQVLYCGAQQQMLPHFELAGGFVCPHYYNPADFAVEVGSETASDERVTMLIERNKQNLTAMRKKSFDHSQDGDEQTAMLTLRTSAVAIEMSTDSTTDSAAVTTTTKTTSAAMPLGHMQISVFMQFVLLLCRTFRTMSRHLLGVQLRVLMHVVVAVLLGVVFWDIGNDGSKVLTNFSCIFFVVMFVFFANAMPSILLCPQDMGVFVREYLNGWYTMPVYYFAKITAELPMLFVCPTCFMSIVFFMTGQPLEFERFVMCWRVLLLTGVIGHLIGLIFGSSCDEQMAVFLVPATTIPFLIFSGFFIRLDEMIWALSPLCDISFFRYMIEGFMQAIYGYGRDPLTCPDAICLFKSPERFLRNLGMWGDLYGRDILVLLIWIILLLLGFFCSLLYRIKRMQ